jgi:hypothetical protein
MLIRRLFDMWEQKGAVLGDAAAAAYKDAR